MEQTFNDLLRARAKKQRGLFRFALWMFVETSVGITRESITSMQNKNMIRIVLATAFILLVPLVAMQFTDEVVWDVADFVVAAVLLLGAGLTYEMVARKAGHTAYRAAVGVAVATALLLAWMNLAVGIIGNEENPANLMYLAVLAVGVIGAFIARFEPDGMVRALVATALTQMLVAVITLVAGLGFTLMLNGLFALLWVVSAALFRRASATNPT
jgi:hypothetical protein